MTSRTAVRTAVAPRAHRPPRTARGYLMNSRAWSAAEHDAWRRHQAGEVVRFSNLPKNGQVCHEPTSTSVCGWPLLVDGSCINVSAHTETSTDRLVSLGHALEEYFQLRFTERQGKGPDG